MTATAAAASSSSANGSSKSEVSDVLKERLIDAEYKIWKKNTPYLYDVVMTHALEWPSLTCQWLPTVKNAGATASEHSLLLGTHTTGEQNYLMVASCNLPKDDVVIDNRTNKEDDSGSKENATSTSTTTPVGTPAASYDEERKEIGGFGHPSSNIGKIEIRMKIQHQGEVNRARYMPQNHFFVATRGPDPEIYVFDLSKHPSFPEEGSTFSPQVVCCGHAKEGYGLSWSKLKQGYLLSGSEDTQLCLWDIMADSASSSGDKTGRQIKPVSTFAGHTNVVEDVDWHAKDPNMMASVSDDQSCRIWDIRENKAAHVIAKAHDDDVNCVSFNPINEYIFATGSADKTVAVWDIRNLKSRCHTLAGHHDQVYMVEWAPFNESILGSCSADRRVGIWDLSRIGMEQSPEDAEDGPPELLFLHGGHTSKVSDFSWNATDPWTLASVSEDNVMQIWQMAEEIYAGEDEEQSSGEGEDKVLGDDELE
eukprot:CAMPEP_0117005082 /NCGR_PEP_ID=MMETSP0472-20121206/5830_1 /TAXON_ID=693140 ORGANISM="Tiarina fusus, Strain LIS" /NCGR_SAMPLE_ID=MMETSP0472 /ASSEMBLY_ACC=CAM_ASM_000603 /LENGTH=478 /DNA_ID=CAMNT_0004706231 /DNA_START=33 /DNA_END=1469 /DNA_ORIENTATION=+